MCTVLTLSRGWRDSWLQCKVDRDACPTIRSIPLKKHSIVTIIRTFCCSPITWREVRNKGPFCSPNSFNSNYNNSSRVTRCWSWNSFLPHDNEFFMVVQVWTFCTQLGKKKLTELPAHKAKTSTVTPSFYCSFSMSYIWLSFVPSLKKHLDHRSFSRKLY